MDIDKFIVKPNTEKHDPIVERWTTPIPNNLKESLDSFPKETRIKIHESTRRFLSHLIEVYASPEDKPAA